MRAHLSTRAPAVKRQGAEGAASGTPSPSGRRWREAPEEGCACVINPGDEIAPSAINNRTAGQVAGSHWLSSKAMWSATSSVSGWLRGRGLVQHAANFVDNKIDLNKIEAD